MYRNSTEALLDGLRRLLDGGDLVESRAGSTRELHGHVMRIERPLERVIVARERRNNVFAALAETFWVLGGRDDMAYLSHYLPNAPDFSDDGLVWRGAYGPRLRNWRGVDQLAEVVRLLTADLSTRRGAMSIFDPALDYTASKDIPCNNWLHFLVRAGRLHLMVALRSNDAIWGFSGINAFEWSVLQQMMAAWTGVEVGSLTFAVSSFHLYDRHFTRAAEMLAKAHWDSLYDHGFEAPRFSTSFADFDGAMQRFFALEGAIRRAEPDVDERIALEPDDLLRTSLQALRTYNVYKSGAPAEAVADALARMPSCDLRIGAIDFLTRQKALRDRHWLELLPAEQAFFEGYWSTPAAPTLAEVYAVLRTLHERKSRVYGNSWKKHGEVLGIFANITRKYDRIESVLKGARATADEGLADTLADLAIYAGKYLTFQAEKYAESFAAMAREVLRHDVHLPDYCHNEGFDAVTELLMRRRGSDHELRQIHDFEQCLQRVRHHYGVLERILTSAHAGECGSEKAAAASDLSLAAAQALALLAARQPSTFAAFKTAVERM
ncbi:MAG: thymidylate synthase [bacterium]